MVLLMASKPFFVDDRTIKDSHTLRNRLPLPRFWVNAIGIVKAWSLKLREEPIKSEKTIPLEM